MNERELLTQGLEMLGLSDPQAVDKLLAFSDVLLETNKVMNLTAVTDPSEVVTRHFLDCAPLAPLAAGCTVVDVGCGAGFPGVPVALLAPTAKVTLLDSLGKRIRFLQQVIDTLPIPNAVAVHGRAEEFGPREGFDLVTSRAVARLNVLAELCLPLAAVGGRFLSMKSVDSDEEIDEARRAIGLLGGEIDEIRDYTVPLTDVRRRLVIIRKVRPTPARYPRRFGKISAQPL